MQKTINIILAIAIAVVIVQTNLNYKENSKRLDMVMNQANDLQIELLTIHAHNGDLNATFQELQKMGLSDETVNSLIEIDMQNQR